MPKENMTYETALSKLKAIVQDMESGNIELDKLGDKLAEAQKLAEYCKAKLEGVEKKVKEVLEHNDTYK